MQKHKRNYLPWILLIFIVLPVHAQKKGYSKGYILTLEGETVEGWVKDRSSGTFIELYERIRFQEEGARLKRKYGPDEILAYGYDDQYFESVPIFEETAFFKFRYYIQEGRDRIFLKVVASHADLTYFHWEYVDGESNYLDYTPLFYRNGSDQMVRVTQGILGLKRNRLIEYFRDCPAMVKAIQRKELHEIDQVYNFYLESCL